MYQIEPAKNQKGFFKVIKAWFVYDHREEDLYQEFANEVEEEERRRAEQGSNPSNVQPQSSENSPGDSRPRNESSAEAIQVPPPQLASSGVQLVPNTPENRPSHPSPAVSQGHDSADKNRVSSLTPPVGDKPSIQNSPIQSEHLLPPPPELDLFGSYQFVPKQLVPNQIATREGRLDSMDLEELESQFSLAKESNPVPKNGKGPLPPMPSAFNPITRVVKKPSGADNNQPLRGLWPVRSRSYASIIPENKNLNPIDEIHEDDEEVPQDSKDGPMGRSKVTQKASARKSIVASSSDLRESKAGRLSQTQKRMSIEEHQEVRFQFREPPEADDMGKTGHSQKSQKNTHPAINIQDGDKSLDA